LREAEETAAVSFLRATPPIEGTASLPLAGSAGVVGAALLAALSLGETESLYRAVTGPQRGLVEDRGLLVNSARALLGEKDGVVA